jgi:hypothetical protein
MYSSIYDVTYDIDSSSYLLIDIINNTSYLHTPMEFRCMVRSHFPASKVEDIIQLVGTLKSIRMVPEKAICGVAKLHLQTAYEVISKFLSIDNIEELQRLNKNTLSDNYIREYEKIILGISQI